MSLLPPPRCIETTIGTSLRRATRASARPASRRSSRRRPRRRRGTTIGRGSSRCRCQHRRRRERDLLLPTNSLGPGARSRGERSPLAVAERARRTPAPAASAGNAGLITSSSRCVEHVLAARAAGRTTTSAPTAAQVLAEQVPAQAGQERQHRRRLEQAAAERVGHGDVAGAHRLHQARHAEERVGAQLQRIAEVVVEPAQDHVDRLQALRASSGRRGRRARSGRRPRPA